jgi:hypothetical protein
VPNYFFLSYAHGEDDDHVARLYLGLCAELRIQLGLPRDSPVGFRDNNSLRVGTAWQAELVEAISAARTFVALYSPRYFRSEVCGQELSVFAQRIAAYERTYGRRAPALIPLVWVASEVPAHLDEIQYGDFSFGDAYARNGARDLVRLTEYHDACLRFVTALALRIKEISAGYVLPPYDGPPTLAGVPNAFDRPTEAAPFQPPSQRSPEPVPGVCAGGQRPVLRYETDSP